MELAIPGMALVVLVGASGSGKSTFARERFRPTQVLSSDYFRGVVSDDETDQAASAEAFDVLRYVAGKRLRAGLVTVVDATNVRPAHREPLIRLAREHHVPAVAIVLDVPTEVCVARAAHRPGRDVDAGVVTDQRAALLASLPGLRREGFKRVYVLRGESEVDSARIVIERAADDLRDQTGPFDVIGDVHGCRVELEDLLAALGYTVQRDDVGHAIGARHPEGRRAVFLGDLVDRGPDTPGVLRLAMGMVEAGTALVVTGNHEEKLVRALRGNPVRVGGGLAKSLEQLAAESAGFRERVERFCAGLVTHYRLDGENLVVAHAGLPRELHGRDTGRTRSLALYGPTTGKPDADGLPERLPWAQDYHAATIVLYGHTPVRTPQWVNNTLCLDTGCVFGGTLTALRYPEREIVSVAARDTYHQPHRPLA